MFHSDTVLPLRFLFTAAVDRDLFHSPPHSPRTPLNSVIAKPPLRVGRELPSFEVRAPLKVFIIRGGEPLPVQAGNLSGIRPDAAGVIVEMGGAIPTVDIDQCTISLSFLVLLDARADGDAVAARFAHGVHEVDHCLVALRGVDVGQGIRAHGVTGVKLHVALDHGHAARGGEVVDVEAVDAAKVQVGPRARERLELAGRAHVPRDARHGAVGGGLFRTEVVQAEARGVGGGEQDEGQRQEGEGAMHGVG